MFEDYFRLAVGSIRSKGVRSWLTMAGIFIGIAAIVSLISLGEGLQNAVNEQFEMLGYDTIYVYPGGEMSFGLGGGSKITGRELDIIKRVSGVDLAMGVNTRVAKLKYRDETTYNYVIGFPTDETQDIFLDGTGITIVRGQKRFKPGDTYKVAVGYEYWIGNAFDQPVELGDKIYINDKKFEIVGFVSRIGNPSDDGQIYIPYDTFKEVFEVGDEYMAVMAKTKPGTEPSKVAEDIKKKLRRDRGLEEGEEDFSVITLEQMLDAASIVLDAVQAVLVGIAAISLFVGGVGIMNTMYTSVLERTREIGVMKSIGARNKDILNLFLVESGIIGMVGGIIGVILGVAAAKLVEIAAEQYLGTTILQADISLWLVSGALAFSFILGSVFGVLPAWQASKLSPVDALRYE
ncbi:MAG: ABC transporter permease [Candidatus Altiarchaeota archaeon]|nr:ABC transporter permease [Candidatus Altiarchaeota archaeon]